MSLGKFEYTKVATKRKQTNTMVKGKKTAVDKTRQMEIINVIIMKDKKEINDLMSITDICTV